MSSAEENFVEAVHAVADALGAERTHDLSLLLSRGRGREHTLTVMQSPGASAAISQLYRTMATVRIPQGEAAAYLRGYVEAWRHRRDEVDVRTVWSGPATPGVPVRATAHVLLEVIGEAKSELLAMTYAARPYAALTTALAAAVGRGVEAHVVVETLDGAAGLLHGPEPATAFTSVSGLRLWHWAPQARSQPGARQHAKLAVADRRVLFLGSANLTEAGARRNLEAGALIRGGTAPIRAAEHITALQRMGALKRLSI
ncbi:DISARM system phospholipase D-like protein DrmC [Streptomyces sp. GSL17-111]|uniref:DISARM system phospholipase D-like protein DrmC n=1 Tax=Streptomyces sp. GSL17-111 TaxID=3121596 RepID=UPI0030F45A6B